MDDAELVRQLRAHEEQISVGGGRWWETPEVCIDAADRIEALIAERDRQYDENVHRIAEQARVEAERDAARDAALEEAAKMVDVFFGQNAFADADLYKWGRASGAQAIAAAIRALKGKSNE